MFGPIRQYQFKSFFRHQKGARKTIAERFCRIFGFQIRNARTPDQQVRILVYQREGPGVWRVLFLVDDNCGRRRIISHAPSAAIGSGILLQIDCNAHLFDYGAPVPKPFVALPVQLTIDGDTDFPSFDFSLFEWIASKVVFSQLNPSKFFVLNTKCLERSLEASHVAQRYLEVKTLFMRSTVERPKISRLFWFSWRRSTEKSRGWQSIN